MKKLARFISFGLAALMSILTPVSTQHGTGNCCSECVMKDEDEEKIELIHKNEKI
jgi:hypothetical protein